MSARVRSSALIATLAVAAIAAPIVALAGGGGATARGVRVLDATDPRMRITASLVLRLPRGALERFLADTSRATSPSFGEHLTPRQFGARFGLPLPRIAALQSELAGHGLSVTTNFPQRTALGVTGTVATFERDFGTVLRNRIDGRGRRWFAPTARPRLPSWLGSDVTAITGLDTRPIEVAADVPAGGLSPTALSHAYDFAALRQAGINGSGETIAVVSYDGFRPSDVAAYESMFSVQGPQIQRITVDGGTQPGAGQQEVDLDLETLHGIAPGAQLVDYEAPSAASDADVINQIVADHRASIISTSWGVCELLLPPAVRAADTNALDAARAAGITVFAASGDEGAYDCQSANLDDQRPSVDWPAASDDVVAVGGTRVSVRQDGSYLAEYGWEDPLQGAGSGGGLASTVARPAWQRGPGVSAAQSDGNRQVPDVGGPGDPASGMVVVTRGKTTEIGGTSAAAPFWAASFALMREYAQRHGVSQIGFLAPLLYELAANPSTRSAFHEPVAGGDRRFSVAPGWNFVTGLGSPDVAVMARDLVALLTRR
ncbi:MAG TPA: S53 family peptidase [Solirubrobacteraceae bacterium]|nr:S53 family peptidase [Solirubrobacteraceae bacterium]